jgi:uncharacterized protein involved in outer membrane biogenesis
MKRILLNPIVLLLILVLVIAAGCVATLPSLFTAQIKQALQLQSGRTVAINGQSRFVFSPHFGLALHDLSLAGASSMAEPAVHAREVIVPLSLSQIFFGRVATDNLVVDGADIEVIINGQGHSNVLIEQNPESAKTDANSPAPQPMHIKLNDSQLHFSDLRNGNDFEVHKIDAVIDASDNFNVEGLALVKEQRLHFTATLNSIARAFADGSPLDLNVDGVDSSFSFSGRIATAESLNLAGQATVESENAPRLWQWLGAKITGLDALQKMSLTGALDSQGPVFFLKQAKLKLGTMNAVGDVSFSNSSERPNLTAKLKFDALDLNAYQISLAPSATGWSAKPIDVSVMNALDAQFQLSADHVNYHNLTTGAATVEGALKDRVLLTSVKSAGVAGGTVDMNLNFDSRQLPPRLKLNSQVENVNGKDFLFAMIGQSWLSGELTGSGDFEAHGESQAELLSTLSGDIDATVKNIAIRSLERSLLAPLITPAKASVKLSISDGIATLGENSFGGSGDVDVLRQALSISVTAPNKQKILVTGPWAEPKISAIAPSLQ